MQHYTIAFYSKAVQNEILDWPHGIKASFVRIAEMMAEHGLTIGMPYIKPMGNGLFEIRAKGVEGIGRALFCTLVNQRLVILHGFIKKTQQTPNSEIKNRPQTIKRGETCKLKKTIKLWNLTPKPMLKKSVG